MSLAIRSMIAENHGSRLEIGPSTARGERRACGRSSVVREEDGERVALGASDLVKTKGRRGSVSAAAARG